MSDRVKAFIPKSKLEAKGIVLKILRSAICCGVSTIAAMSESHTYSTAWIINNRDVPFDCEGLGRILLETS
jgi:hypothetical protein